MQSFSKGRFIRETLGSRQTLGPTKRTLQNPLNTILLETRTKKKNKEEKNNRLDLTT